MNSGKKIINLFNLQRIVNKERRRGKKIIFTNGCFDILHPGHVGYLEKAKEKNSILIVGLNSDSSVKEIKDQTRPINPESQRAKVLAGLSAVDYVVIFREATPLNLIRALKPDCLVKGADWKDKGIVGEEYAGRVKLATYLKQYSTSKIIARILKLCPK